MLVHYSSVSIDFLKDQVGHVHRFGSRETSSTKMAIMRRKTLNFGIEILLSALKSFTKIQASGGSKPTHPSAYFEGQMGQKESTVRGGQLTGGG
jgi:hypothetical protein